MRDERGRWLKGSASPSPGRPVGSRSKLGDAFVESLQRKWETEGDSIVDRVAMNNPEKILEVMARVLPKELAVTVQQTVDPRLKALQQMDADALAALGGLIDATKVARLKAPSRDRSSPGSRKTSAPEWLCQSRNL